MKKYERWLEKKPLSIDYLDTKYDEKAKKYPRELGGLFIFPTSKIILRRVSLSTGRKNMKNENENREGVFIPNEIFFEILKFLTLFEISNFRYVSRRMCQLIHTESCVELLCRRLKFSELSIQQSDSQQMSEEDYETLKRIRMYVLKKELHFSLLDPKTHSHSLLFLPLNLSMDIRFSLFEKHSRRFFQHSDTWEIDSKFLFKYLYFSSSSYVVKRLGDDQFSFEFGIKNLVPSSGSIAKTCDVIFDTRTLTVRIICMQK